MLIIPVTYGREETKSFVIIDTLYISENSHAMKDFKTKVNQIRMSYEQETKQMEEDLKIRLETLEKKSKVLSEKEYFQQKEEFEKEVTNAKKKFYRARLHLENLNTTASEAIEKNIINILHDSAQILQFDIVLEKIICKYSNSGLDISDHVIRELNKRLLSIESIAPIDK